MSRVEIICQSTHWLPKIIHGAPYTISFIVIETVMFVEFAVLLNDSEW